MIPAQPWKALWQVKLSNQHCYEFQNFKLVHAGQCGMYNQSLLHCHSLTNISGWVERPIDKLKRKPDG
jgi:hypothetical protein